MTGNGGMGKDRREKGQRGDLPKATQLSVYMANRTQMATLSGDRQMVQSMGLEKHTSLL